MTTAPSTAPTKVGLDASHAAGRTARQIAGVAGVGAGLGLLVGGIGGRLAMRALFLTSHPSVRGVTSDDGFRIGQFSPAATLNLLVLGTVVGVIGAFVYLAVRPFLMGPRWLRITGCALAAGAVVGSMLVHTDGVDFQVLSPRWFAIALFVVQPALFAALAVPAVEWALRDDGWFQRAPAQVALLPLVVFVFPPLLVIIGVPVALVLAGRSLLARSPRAAAYAGHRATLWSVRAAWVAIALLGLVRLTRETMVLL